MSGPGFGDALGGDATPTTSYVLRVNGEARLIENAWIGENLLYVLRERLGLPGAKDGCGQGVCGTCTVQLDGVAVAACLIAAATLGDREIRTIEDLDNDPETADVQRALIEAGAVQCGFCVPGVVTSVCALLARVAEPSEVEIRRALDGHPCRCAGPHPMVDAVRIAARRRVPRQTHSTMMFNVIAPPTSGGAE
ncbi:(2Fe-2S)-binding protein [Embleya hyalina]|uniref:Carbon-monoxide dehydrogenase small subunit n=1 Tax=Embleya hyalina TaxID=516124 RepID=A0A401Z5C3_9ACTN|nr:2Fe-2S iron-sulfur cluster-binding protein [Embleya hyalina]GCE02060.1 carbon-monoxide dehydrogenase small subunit [Embleya hyalina]